MRALIFHPLSYHRCRNSIRTSTKPSSSMSHQLLIKRPLPRSVVFVLASSPPSCGIKTKKKTEFFHVSIVAEPRPPLSAAITAEMTRGGGLSRSSINGINSDSSALFTMACIVMVLTVTITLCVVMFRRFNSSNRSKKENFASKDVTITWVSRDELMQEPGVVAYFMQMTPMDCYARLPENDPFVVTINALLHNDNKRELMMDQLIDSISLSSLNEARHRVMAAYAKKVVDPAAVRGALAGAVDKYIQRCAQKAEDLIMASKEWSRVLSQSALGPWRIAALRRTGEEPWDAPENGYPHTFGSTICFTLFGGASAPAADDDGEDDNDVIVQKDAGLIKTLIHERVHVLQRSRESWVDHWLESTYKCAQVGPFDAVLPAEIRWRRRSNPDLDGVLWKCQNDSMVQIFNVDPLPRSLKESYTLSYNGDGEEATTAMLDGAAEHPYERMAYALADEITS